MDFRPLYDRLVVERLPNDPTTPGGIIIPDNSKQKMVQGKVLTVGNGKVMADGTLRPLDVKTGDTVFYLRYSGCEVDLEGRPLLVLKEEEVLGVVSGAA